jgi:dihydrolipoamide dehydrogenase
MVVGSFAREAALLVIGGGRAGCAAAVRGAALGLQTILVDPLDPRDGPDAAGSPRAAATIDACRDRGVDVVEGRAAFGSTREVTVPGAAVPRIRFRRAVVATGACLAEPPGDWPDSPAVLRRAAEPRATGGPRTLLVSGASAPAVEAAARHAALGTQVVLAVPGERILPEADPDLAELVALRLSQSVEVLACTAAEAVRGAQGGIEATLGGKRRRFDAILAAQWLVPSTARLCLEKAQVRTGDGGFILVDEHLRTSNPRILAAGGVTGAPFSAAKATLQGRIAAEVAAGTPAAIDAVCLPFVVEADPPLAWCGLTRQEAEARAIPHQVATARRDCDGGATALARLLVDPAGGTVLGVALYGRGAALAIGEGALAVEMGAVAEDLASTVRGEGLLSILLTEAASCLGAAGA